MEINWETTLKDAIELVLRGWTALDLQVANNPHEMEIRKWMPEPISQALQDNPCEDEMEEWLAGLLDSNFHLVCEDDSCFEVARHLVQVNRLVHRKDHQKLLEYCEKLPKGSGVATSTLSKNEEDSSSDEESSLIQPLICFHEDDCNPPVQQNAPKAKRKEEMDEMEVEDGWNVVRK